MKIIEIKKNNFDEEVLNSDKKVLVDFYAEWCGPCKMIRPILEDIAENDAAVKIASVNVESEEELAEKYDVSSIPCLILFDGGKEISRNVGLMSKDDVKRMIGE